MSGAIAAVLAILVLLLTGILLARLTRPLVKSSPTGDSTSETETSVVEAVNAVLPQTQCAQCGYPGCRPYAEAIVYKNESINRCPPGGENTIAQLSHLLGTPALPLNTELGTHKPEQIAYIDEAECIGCTLCILACPVDAIVGASKQMHTVIADDCTGCELCLPPCPVDCIVLQPPGVKLATWHWPKPD